MLEALSQKQKIIFFMVLSIMIIFIIYYIYSTLYKDDFSFNANNIINNDLIETNLSDKNIFSENTLDNFIIVYICGAVKESKVVTLPENSRISDAIEAAGGLKEEADITNINLAYILEDGDKVYIPQKGEELQSESSASSTVQNSSYSNYSSTSIKNNKVNINKASQVELETIPGIGPSTALKIIDYRKQNGKFKSIEDIKNVSGIGDAKYEKMKDYITVK